MPEIFIGTRPTGSVFTPNNCWLNCYIAGCPKTRSVKLFSYLIKQHFVLSADVVILSAYRNLGKLYNCTAQLRCNGQIFRNLGKRTWACSERNQPSFFPTFAFAKITNRSMCLIINRGKPRNSTLLQQSHYKSGQKKGAAASAPTQDKDYWAILVLNSNPGNARSW